VRDDPQAAWRAPMLAQPLRMPEEKRLVNQPGWLFERKLDGLRCVAVRNGQEVELWSRNHLPFTARFPEITAALAGLPVDNFTIDGELVAFDGNRTSFALLQRPQPGSRPQFHVFDLLHLLGHDTTVLPLFDRKRLLAQALESAGEGIYVVTAVEGDPQVLLEQACAAGWEGIIGKRQDRPYLSGRSPDWRKLKCSISQDLVVGGWSDPGGSRIGLGALLVGYFDEEGELHYAGKVGTGFDDKELAGLRRVLNELRTDRSPFVELVNVKGAHWVRPHLVIAVDFTEWTNVGRLRHPRFGGVRPDKAPTDVRREQPED
jgi:bifunctional non-homologous end joining protein LigD